MLCLPNRRQRSNGDRVDEEEQKDADAGDWMEQAQEQAWEPAGTGEGEDENQEQEWGKYLDDL
jgi:hypothetical protein